MTKFWQYFNQRNTDHTPPIKRNHRRWQEGSNGQSGCAPKTTIDFQNRPTPKIVAKMAKP